MFYSVHMYTSLVESILKEKKIDLDNNKTEAITEVFYKIALLPLMSKTLKNSSNSSFVVEKVRLEAYNFSKNELLCRHFSDYFTQIQSRCFLYLEI